MNGLAVYTPPQGLCQPGALKPIDEGGLSLVMLGLSDDEIRTLAIWLKLHHPESFECALLQISEDRKFAISGGAA